MFANTSMEHKKEKEPILYSKEEIDATVIEVQRF